jgi:hypothetical protein
VAEPVRVVAVLGYSARRGDGLHPVCSVRLRHAESLAGGANAVVLSGWGRRDGQGEAELMRSAWAGPDVPLVCDLTARSTADNAVGVASASLELGAERVVVVTSWWHAPRAGALVRAALRGSGVAVETSPVPGKPPLRLLVRELACLAAIPLQIRRCRAQPRASWTRARASSSSSEPQTEQR